MLTALPQWSVASSATSPPHQGMSLQHCYSAWLEATPGDPPALQILGQCLTATHGDQCPERIITFLCTFFLNLYHRIKSQTWIQIDSICSWQEKWDPLCLWSDRLYDALWKKKKMLVTPIFFFHQNVFYTDKKQIQIFLSNLFCLLSMFQSKQV